MSSSPPNKYAKGAAVSVEKNWKWQSLTICSQLLKNSTILQDPLPFEGLDNQKSIISQLICKKKNFKTISLFSHSGMCSRNLLRQWCRALFTLSTGYLSTKFWPNDMPALSWTRIYTWNWGELSSVLWRYEMFYLSLLLLWVTLVIGV